MNGGEISLNDFKKAFIKFIKISKNPELVILGGEPTLYKNLINIIDKAKEINNDTVVTLFTNGTLINKKLSDYIVKNRINLVISLDGEKASNDQQKNNLITNRSAYDTTLSNLKRYKLIKLSTVNIVITKKTLKFLNKNITHLHSLGFNSIGFNIDYSDNWEEKDKIELKKQIKSLFLDYAKKLKTNKKLFRFSNIYEIFDFLKYGDLPKCQNIILLPDGKFYLCDKIVTANGKNKKKFMIKNDILSERAKFFKDMKKKGLANNQLFCKIGLYLYFRYFKNLKNKKLQEKLKNVFELQKILEKELVRYISILASNKRFRRLHRI